MVDFIENHGLHRTHTQVSRVVAKIPGCGGENDKEAENCVLMTGVDTERGTRGEAEEERGVEEQRGGS